MNMKTFKNVSYLILGSIFFFSCSQEKKLEPKRTVIAGVVSNFSKDDVLVVNYCNPFLGVDEDDRFRQILAVSNGCFWVEQEYVFAQNITIRLANRFINFFVRPGDSIFVSIDAKEVKRNFNNAVTFSGDNAKLNKELFIWHNYSYNYHSYKDYNLLFADSVSPKDFLANLKYVFDKAQDSIMAYSKTNMSNFLKKWAYIDCKYTVANYIMDYNNPEANRWNIFTNPIFDVFNENNFQTMYFSYHLGVCMNALVKGDAEISRLISKKEYAPAIQLTIEKLHEKAPKGVVRDMMLFRYLGYVFEEKPELYDSVPEVSTAFSQTVFGKQLGKIVERNKNKIAPPTKISEAERQLSGIWYMKGSKTEKLRSEKLLNFLVEKHKGKVLYIDVWATWCGPCIKEFQSSPTLHQYFKGKDVVFVNLCLGSSKIENWKQTVAKYSIGGENYFFDNVATELFQADNKLRGYPSYLIIDKNGEIHRSAPRPSELEVAIQKIESCLK